MSDKDQIHITPDGPEKCTATERNCKYNKNGGQHYTNVDEAQEAYDKQMKEQHGSFVVKKNVYNEEEINKINIKEAMKNIDEQDYASHANPYAAIDRDDTSDKMVYKYDKEFTQLFGNTINETLENFDKEQARLEKLPHNTEHQLIDNIVSNEAVDGITIIYEEDNEYDDKERMDNKIYTAKVEPVTKSIDFNAIDYGYYDEFDGGLPAPLSDDRKLKHTYYEDAMYVDKDNKYPRDQYDYSDAEFSYELNDKEYEGLQNQRKIDFIKKYKTVADNPATPKWVVLPKQKNADYLHKKPYSLFLEKDTAESYLTVN